MSDKKSSPEYPEVTAELNITEEEVLQQHRFELETEETWPRKFFSVKVSADFF